jgi:NAD(P)H-dependent FMN reductase
MKILILNGSPQGDAGNCGLLTKSLPKLSLKRESTRPDDLQWETVHLARVSYSQALARKILKAYGLLFVTGTYWDSWGSTLQKFLEQATELEANPQLVGKPAGVVVLEHSVGGKSVLSRLQGVLSTFGFLVPPFSGMVFSLAGKLASQQNHKHSEDFWCLDDLEVILGNLILAAEQNSVAWHAWPVDRKNFRKTWLK